MNWQDMCSSHLGLGNLLWYGIWNTRVKNVTSTTYGCENHDTCVSGGTKTNHSSYIQAALAYHCIQDQGAGVCLCIP